MNTRSRFCAHTGPPRLSTLFRSLVVLLIGSAILVPLQYGTAATISVNTYVDVVANDGKCSLREAVTAVNTSATSGNTNGECAAGDGNNDTIMLPATTYYLTIAGANENLNATGDLDLRASMTIAGAGMDSTIINGPPDRVMQIIGPSIQVSLQDLMISGGHAPDGSDEASGARGGALLVSNATLTLQHVELSGNLGGRGGNAFDNQFSSGGDGGAGGGLAADASVVIVSDSVLTANHAGDGGNAAEAYMSHAGFGGDGGAISLINNSTLTLQRSSLTANASGLAGLLDADADSGYGGALCLDSSSTAIVIQSDIDGNAAGDTSIGSNGGGIAVRGGGTLEVTQSSVTRNVSRLGGGIYVASPATLLLHNGTLAANQASAGGAIFVQNTSAVIDLATISGNTAAIGSGIAILTINQDVNISNSIVSGNGGGGTDCQIYGGGNPDYTSAGYNIAGSGCPSDGTADIMTTDPQLGPLSANGGLGDTMMPHPTSPATDAGSCAASSVYVDERTHTRPSDVPRVANVADGCDIGAVELDDDLFWDGLEG